MGSFATEYGQGRGALCRDMESMSRQGTPLSRQKILCHDKELKKVRRDKKFRVMTGLGELGAVGHAETKRLVLKTACATALDCARSVHTTSQ